MNTIEERSFFEKHGYLSVHNALSIDEVNRLRQAFDSTWDPKCTSIKAPRLLQSPCFLWLTDHPEIRRRVGSVFGNQVQLLSYDCLMQTYPSDFPIRSWHRDFSFPGNRPIAINCIVYLDDMSLSRGPSWVIPGSHLLETPPPEDLLNKSIEGEIPIVVSAGSILFINSALWHTGSRNQVFGMRRNVFLYFGYWWLKQYFDKHELPKEATLGATDDRLQLLGLKMPGSDLHMYSQKNASVYWGAAQSPNNESPT